MTPVILVLAVFAAALTLTAAGVPLVRRLARGGGLYEQPVADRWHRRPVPKLGGVAMAAGFLVTAAVVGDGASGSLLLGAPILLFALGLIDDLRPMGPTAKFAGQIAVAVGFLALAPPIHLTGEPAADFILAFIWFVGITNAFNLLDNIDGLAAGVAAIAGGFLVVALLVNGSAAVVVLALPVAAITGVAVGFLFYNRHPASIFMGDGGSHLLGGFFASATLLAVPHLQIGSPAAVAIAVVLLLVPCADTVLVVLTRQLAGRSAFVGGRDHLSHRIVALGMSDRRAVLVLYAVAFLGGLAALGLQMLTAPLGWALAAVYAVGVAAIGAYLGHVDVRADARTRALLPLPTELTARYRGYEIVLDLLLIALAYYLGLVTRFRRPDEFSGFLESFTRILPLVAILHLAALWAVGKYRKTSTRTGLSSAMTILQGAALGSAASVIAVLYLTRFEGYSRLAFVVAGAFVVAFLWSELFVLRALDELLRRRRQAGPMALVYGAGHRGALAARELRNDPTIGLTPYGFIDDDRTRRNDRVEGLRVLGTLDDLDTLVASARGRVTTLIVTMPDLPDGRLDRLCATCARHGIEVRRLRFSLDDVDTDRRRNRGSGVIRFPKA